MMQLLYATNPSLGDAAGSYELNMQSYPNQHRAACLANGQTSLAQTKAQQGSNQTCIRGSVTRSTRKWAPLNDTCTLSNTWSNTTLF